MIIHYFKIAFRNMWKYKNQTLVGIAGLSVAFAFFVLGSYWLRYENNYDTFYPDAERIKLMTSHDIYGQEWLTDVLMPLELANELVVTFPEIETAGRAFTLNTRDTYYMGGNYYPIDAYIVDTAFINMFTFDYVEGSKQDVIRQWDKFLITDSMLYCGVVLTESLARKIFGNEPAIGKTVKDGMPSENKVLAVIRDLPQNSNFKYDALSSVSLDHSGFFSKGWDRPMINVYIKLKPHINEKELQSKLENFLVERGLRTHTRLVMMPLENIHKTPNEVLINGNYKDYPIRYEYVIIFVVAALLLLLCAYLNFITLSLSRCMDKIKGQGLRKVLGAERAQLNGLLLFSLCMEALIAFLLSAAIIHICIPFFGTFIFLDIHFEEIAAWFFVCMIAGVLLTLLTGIFPIHRINALRILTGGRKSGWQKFMVSAQLFIGTLFIFGVTVVARQFSFLQNTELGFDRQDIVHTYKPSKLDWQTFKAALENNPNILQSTALHFPFLTDKNHGVVDWDGKTEKDLLIQVNIVDGNFHEFFGIRMQSGDFFTPGQSNDNDVVINQTAARIMGFDNPIGRTVKMYKDFQIIGVVGDFHILPLRKPVEPMVLMCTGRRLEEVYVRINPAARQEALAYLQETYEKYASPGELFKYDFLVEEYASYYRSEKALLTVFGLMATVCLLISAFGIYSMMSMSIRLRRKEIAIRKVAGAEAGNIANMFFREYFTLTIIVNIFAFPLAFAIMSRWLQRYAYRIDVGWQMFAAVFVLIITVVLLTILGQVLRASRRNPADVVKSE